jgi:uncharacterized protein
MGHVQHEVRLQPPQLVASTVLRIWLPLAGGRRTALLLAPAAGSSSAEPVVGGLADELSGRGVPVGVFDFPYRRAGRRLPDRQERLERAFRDVATEFAMLTGTGCLVLGGRSLGGRIASHLAASGDGDGLLALAYPLWPQGRGPDPRRTAHWPAITVPLLFVHGDRDRLCPVDALEAERTLHLRNATSEVHVVAGADHGFHPQPRHSRSTDGILHELTDAVDRWLAATFDREAPDG